jgi:hypothetical protein
VPSSTGLRRTVVDDLRRVVDAERRDERLVARDDGSGVDPEQSPPVGIEPLEAVVPRGPVRARMARPGSNGSTAPRPRSPTCWIRPVRGEKSTTASAPV